MFTRKPIVTVGAGALVVLGALGLSGCANPLDVIAQQGAENAIENLVEDAAKEHGVEIDINTDGGSASIPSDWPSAVPVPSGEIAVAGKAGDVFTLMITTERSAIDSAISQMRSAGFEEQSMLQTSDGEMIGLEGSGYNVSIIIGSESSGKVEVMYTVMKTS